MKYLWLFFLLAAASCAQTSTQAASDAPALQKAAVTEQTRDFPQAQLRLKYQPDAINNIKEMPDQTPGAGAIVVEGWRSWNCIKYRLFPKENADLIAPMLADEKLRMEFLQSLANEDLFDVLRRHPGSKLLRKETVLYKGATAVRLSVAVPKGSLRTISFNDPQGRRKTERLNALYTKLYLVNAQGAYICHEITSLEHQRDAITKESRPAAITKELLTNAQNAVTAFADSIEFTQLSSHK